MYAGIFFSFNSSAVSMGDTTSSFTVSIAEAVAYVVSFSCKTPLTADAIMTEGPVHVDSHHTADTEALNHN